MAPVLYSGPHADELAQLFVTFCSFGSSKRVEEMDGAKFAKFCRDTKIVDKKFTATDVDLTYAKAKAKGARKIDHAQFIRALELVAEKKGVSLDDIVAKAVAAGGPSSSGTQAEPNKFHDDKSLYTGTHVQGGPTSVDNVITLSNLADRSSADVRGLPKRLSDDGKPKFDRAEKGGYAAAEPSGGSPKKAALSSQSSFKAEKRVSGSYTGGSVQDVFEDFCSFGAGSAGKAMNQMDGAKFAKLCKDCGLVDKKFTTTSVDLVFSKVKPKGERKITFSQFQAALAAIAETKGCSLADVEAKVVSASGPSSSGTVAEAVKFHDDKSLYTGVHAKGGPTTVDNKITLSSLADRTASDIRGIKISDKN